MAGVLTRLMCSSFTDGAAAVVLGGPSTGAARPVRPVSSAPWPVRATARSTTTTGWPRWPGRPGRPSASARRDFDLVELHDATSAEELFALESLGFFGPGDAGPATLAGETAVGGRGLTVNPSGGLVGRGHPLGATGHRPGRRAVRPTCGAERDPARSQGPGWGWPSTPGGSSRATPAYVGIHAVAAAG